MILDKLAASRVDATRVIRDPAVSTGVAGILVDDGGNNVICIAPQANGRLVPSDLEAAASAIARAGHLLLQLEIPIATAVAAATMAKASGATVILNPAPAPLDGKVPADLSTHVDVLVVNEAEATTLSGTRTSTVDEAGAAARALQALGWANVIVTLGAHGALLLERDGRITARPAFDVDVLDMTAAGDAFCGALAAALDDDKTLVEALDWGCAGGALACTKLGAEPSLPERAAIEEIVSRAAHRV